jgi:hypothetical protein
MNYVTSESAQVTEIVDWGAHDMWVLRLIKTMSAFQQLPDRTFVQEREAYRLWDIEEWVIEIQSTNNQEHAKKY